MISPNFLLSFQKWTLCSVNLYPPDHSLLVDRNPIVYRFVRVSWKVCHDRLVMSIYEGS